MKHAIIANKLNILHFCPEMYKQHWNANKMAHHTHLTTCWWQNEPQELFKVLYSHLFYYISYRSLLKKNTLLLLSLLKD